MEPKQKTFKIIKTFKIREIMKTRGLEVIKLIVRQ